MKGRTAGTRRIIVYLPPFKEMFMSVENAVLDEGKKIV